MADQTDPDALVTLAFFDTEIQATLVAQALQEAGLRAQPSGTLTAGFRAEAPGSVQVLVREADLAAAEAIYVEFLAAHEPVDWDQVDVGEMEEGALP